MLVLLHKLARKLSRARKPLLQFIPVMVALLIWMLVSSRNQAQDIYLIPAIAVLVWMVLLVSFISLFADVPQPVEASAGWLARFRRRMLRAMYTFFALLTLLITAALLVTTYQLFMAWLYMYIL